MTASICSLRSLFASTRNLFALLPGPVVCLLLTVGVVCATQAAARPVTVSYSGAFEVLGGALTYPTGVAIDSGGNVYLAMPDLDAVEEIPAGCIAGANNNSCVVTLGSGFSQPFGVAVDSSGNVYVADTDNDAVKVILASCITANTSTTSASCVTPLGSGFSEPYGVAVDRSGNLYVADTFHSAVKMIAASCVSGAISPADPVACNSPGDTVITTPHFFAIPIGIAADASGDIYVADASLGTVHEIPASCISGGNDSSCVITLGGGFVNPYGLTVDGSGNVFVADVGTSKIAEIPSGCALSSCVVPIGGGFNTPDGVTVDASENVYVTDTTNNLVKKLWLQGADFGAVPVNTGTPVLRSLIFTFTQANEVTLGAPVVVTEGATSKDFTDAGTGSCTANGTSHSYNTGDVCTVDASFTPQYPGERMGAVLLENQSGQLLATGRIYGSGESPQITFAGTTNSIFAPNTTAPLGSGFNSPVQLAVDGNGNVFAADQGANKVYEIPAAGGSPIPLATTTGGPTAVALDGAGNLYYADLNNGTVYEILWAGGSYNGTAVALASAFSSPTGLAVDRNGNVFVTSATAGKIYEIEAVNGVIPASPGVVQLASATTFTSPYSLAVDSGDNLYVGNDDALAGITAASGYTTVNSLAGFSGHVNGVAMDAAGDIYVASNDSIYEVMAVGGSIPVTPVVNTVGGGFSGPLGVALDGSGNVYVSDTGHSQVDKLDFVDAPTLGFAATSIGFTSSDSPQTVTAVNDGNQPLNFYGLGTPVDFPLASSGESVCSSSTILAMSAFCTLPIDFTPGNTGWLSESYTLTDNNLNAQPTPGAQQSIPVNATGNPAPDTTTTYVSAGSNALNTGQTMTVTATVADTGVRGTTPTGSVIFNWTCSGICGYDNGTVSDSISQATASINVAPYSVTYDANAHTATGTATGVGSVNLIASLNLTGTTHTNANNYPSDSWSFHDLGGNYADACGSVSDAILQATASITVTPYSLNYDGNPHTAIGTATGVGGANLNADLTLMNTTHTNAGDYGSDSWSFTDPNGNYMSASGTVSDTIAKASAMVNVTPYDVTYDGNAHTATGIATGVGGANLGADLTLTNTTHTNAGGYSSDSWSFTDPNGNYASASGTVFDTIAKASAAVNVTPYNVIYDGNAHTATAAISGVGGVTLSSGDVNLTGTSHTSAGSYLTDAWSFHDSSGNYADTSGTVSDIIAKATATTNVSGYSLTYDGTPHTATATATGVGGVSLSSGDFTLTGTTHTNAGSYASDAWSFTDPNGNYMSTSGTVSDAITKASVTVNVTPYSVTYDGTVHTATGTATGVESVNLIADLTLTDTTHTNAGSYSSDSWTFTDPNGNYTSASGTVSDTIAKASATTNVSGYSVTYDGNAHTATATATGVGGVSLSSGDFTLTNTTHTNAGSYTSDAWSFHDSSGNYADASGTVADTIAKATATVNVTPYSVTYDGATHTATGTAAGAGGVPLSNGGFTLTGTAHANAGSYPNDVWSFSDPNGNYSEASGTVSDTISQATVTTNVSGYSVTYDGNAHTATATATGAGGVSLSSGDFIMTGTTHTNAGSYPNDAWSFSDPSGNYANASGTVSDILAKATVTASVSGYSVTYDGNAHTASGTATGVSGANLNADLILTNTTHTTAGSYTEDTWSFADPNNNYTSVSGTVSDSIAKASATVSVTPYSVTYDGNTHTATGTAAGVGSANLNADLTLTNTTHTNAGSYAGDAWSFTDPNGNYASTSGTVSDTIAKATATTDVTGYTVTYDGNAHTAAATATGVGGASLSSSDFNLTGTTHSNVGSYAGDAWSFSDLSGNYMSASGTVTDTINGATATVTLGGLAQTYTGSQLSATASTSPSGLTVSFTYTGIDGTNYGPSSTPPTSAGSYTVVGTISGTTDYSGSISGTLVIAKAGSQVANLASNSNPAAPGSQVTFTATVTSTAGTPTGTVTFTDNAGTTLGQGTLSNGVATVTVDFTNAQDGANSITAVYSGDANFLGASGGPLTETVMALSLSTGPGGVATQTVSSGGVAAYILGLTPPSGTSFPTAVTLTVSGMPAGATATISPSTWTQITSTSWSLPANTALTAITLSIQLPATSSRLEDRQDSTGRGLPPVLWGILLLPFAGILRRAGKRMRRATSLVLLLTASLAVATTLGGCGNGSSSSNTTQPSDYKITVTAASDSVSSSTTLTLVVN